LAGLVVLFGSPLHAAAIYTETWSTPGNDQGWFLDALGLTNSSTTTIANGEVTVSNNYTSSSGWLTGFQAQSKSTNSNFSGDFSAAGIIAASFDMAVDSDSLGTTDGPVVRILFTSSVNGSNSYWLHDFDTAPTIGGGYAHFQIPLDAQDWTQYLGSADFSDAIKNVGLVEIDYIRMGDYPAYSQTVRLDNVALVPEPVGAAAAWALALLIARRRRNE
jgi:hypothetical protein